jgi:hypothetical protein
MLKQYNCWVSNDSAQNSLFQQMKQTWKIVWLLALKVMSPIQIMSDELGLVFTYSTRRIMNHRIELANLKELMTLLMIEAKEQL